MKFDTTLLSLRPFGKEHLQQTYEWLHDPEIQDITKTAPFTHDEQLKWFNSLENRNDFTVKALYANEEFIGAWGLKRINRQEKHAEPYYYIGNRSYWGIGIGNWLMNKSIEACKELGLSTIIAIMFVKNFRIVNLHFKQGFRINKYEDGLYYMDKNIESINNQNDK